MEIVTAPNKILENPTKEVKNFNEDLKRLVEKMKKTLKEQKDPEGVGLSANQVGINLKVAVVRLNPHEQDAPPNLMGIVNPKITSYSQEEEEVYEGCLSIPKKYAPVKRSLKVTVEAKDIKGNPIKVEPEGFVARIFQHEVDHLEGKLISDRSEDENLYSEEELDEMFEHQTNGKTT